jgi:hypothetical protein
VHTWTIFSCAVGGSLAVELVALNEVYQAQRYQLHWRYRKVGFYIGRLLMACVAGWLAIVYEIDKPLLAVQVGASAPLLLRALARGMLPPANPRSGMNLESRRSVNPPV